MRETIIAGNWKMNVLPSEVPKFVEGLGRLRLPEGLRVVICPPHLSVFVLALTAGMGARPIDVGAQDLSVHDSGAYTGEVSGAMLADAGAKFVIVGHSERRAYHGETDAVVNAKTRAALRHGLRPIICVGESGGQRAAGETDAVVRTQVTAALSGLDGDELSRIVVAYEPIWAIGTGKTATARDAQDVCYAIRATVRSIYAGAGETPILYGGSMNAGNAAELLARPDIDGGLIGGASLDPAAFLEIIGVATKSTNKGGFL